VRFVFSSKPSFSGTVIGLEKIKKFDDRPFLVCLLRTSSVQTFLANSSLVKKVSHTSQRLSSSTIRGSINGSDILRELGGTANTPANFEALYEQHASFSWEENLERIVAATTAITPTGKRFEPTPQQVEMILRTPSRSQETESSGRLSEIEAILERRLVEHRDAVVKAAEIDNVNLRGNAIEQLLTGAQNFHRLEDSVFAVEGQVRILVDLKTKLLDLSSNPKLYNIDKTLRHLADGKSMLCIFFIGIDRPAMRICSRLVDILDAQLLASTRIQFHWAGRNSRGVTQLSGDLHRFFEASFRRRVELQEAQVFLTKLLRES